MESSRTKSSVRNRASTSQSTVPPLSPNSERRPIYDESQSDHADIFEKESINSRETKDGTATPGEEAKELPEGFDDLPIELVSMTDRYKLICEHDDHEKDSLIEIVRFIDSLTAKVHSEPPTIERLSDMFQDFYSRAEVHIATHISALSTKQNKGTSPTPSISSKSSGKRLRSMSSKDTIDSPISAPEQQMLTPQEISDRRRARRLLEQKRLALEEAVERRTCEKVYKRIWRHRSTLDEVRDEKLRSRTAALALVGIGLGDLGIEIDSTSSNGLQCEEEAKLQIEDWLGPARDGLLRMNEARYPLGKLQHLAAAHKCIVDVLSRLRQGSSSADEILPTLIYTLITSPTEGINVISNLNFTQRFRASNKIDGEAAYCLTNLEAAISFLETVDLATLRSDEPLEGPPKTSSQPSTPRGEGNDNWAAGPPLPLSTGIPVTAAADASPARPLFADPLQTPPPEEDSLMSPPSHRRSRSNLLQPTANALGAASDAVRSTADQSLKNIGSTLDHSFKFLFGRLKEQHVLGEGDGANGAVMLPKTLDDARKLVDPQQPEDDQGDNSEASSVADHLDEPIGNGSKFDEKLLGVFAGRKTQPRDRSVDSLQSSGSGGKKVAFVNASNKTRAKADSISQLSSSPTASEQLPASAPNSTVESMRSFGNALNPLNRFAGMSVMRGFGRTSSGTTPTLATTTAASEAGPSELVDMPTGNSLPPPSSPAKVAPPIKRFMDVSDAGELKIGEIAELLQDYRRLATALKAEGKM
ncbi:MAG: hypothetical protein Q9222_000220 [Ikaeria aurantiellina]